MTHFVKNEDDGLLFCIALRLWSSWLARTAPFSQAEPGYFLHVGQFGGTRGHSLIWGAPAPLAPLYSRHCLDV